MMRKIHKKYQIGNITSEYLLATTVVLVMLFGFEFDEKPVWQFFLEAFQTGHNKYAQTISNLDMVDVKEGQANSVKKSVINEKDK